jgi:hypothetical protein
VSETTTSAAPVKTRKPRKAKKKQERFCRIVKDQTGVRTLRLTIDGKVDLYDLQDIASDYGRGFALTKPDGTVYHVNLDGPLCSTCDCPGFTKWSKCKHRDSLAALEAAGRL